MSFKGRPERAGDEALRETGAHGSDEARREAGARAHDVTRASGLDPVSGTEATSDRARNLRVDAAMALLVIGYGLFKSFSDQMYASAMSTVASSYLVINSVGFSISVSYFVIVATAVLLVLAWRWPGMLLRRAGAACTVLLAVTNLASYLGLLGGMDPLVCRILLAAAYGACVTVANVAWLVAIAGLGPRRCLATLATSLLFGAIVSAVAGALPAGVLAVMTTLAGVAVAMLLVVAPREPEVAWGFCAEAGVTRAQLLASGQELPGAWECTRAVVAEHAGPIVIFLVLNMVLGLMMSFQLVDQRAVAGTATWRFVATAASGLILVGVAALAKGMPDIRRIFGLLFPAVALLLVITPFVDPVYGVLFDSSLVFLRGTVGTMLLFMLLEAAHRHRVSPAVLVAGISLVARVAILVGLVAGTLLGWRVSLDATVKTLLVSFVTVYLFSLVLVWLTRGRAGRGARKASGSSDSAGSGQADDPEAIALIAALEGPGAEKVMPSDDPSRMSGEGDPASGTVRDPVPPAPADPLELRAAELAAAFGLTAREVDVSLLLARGRSASYIADALGISENTVRGYAKNVYAKLGVHKKQELIDLFSQGAGE